MLLIALFTTAYYLRLRAKKRINSWLPPASPRKKKRTVLTICAAIAEDASGRWR